MNKEKILETNNCRKNSIRVPGLMAHKDNIIRHMLFKIKNENISGWFSYYINESHQLKNSQAHLVLTIIISFCIRHFVKAIIKILHMPQAEMHILTTQLNAYCKKYLYKYSVFKNIVNFLLDFIQVFVYDYYKVYCYLK